jgi:hypothetical protein
MGDDDARNRITVARAKAEALREEMRKTLLCCICCGPIGVEPQTGWRFGHNAAPLMKGRCCAECDDQLVRPLRIRRLANGTWTLPSRQVPLQGRVHARHKHKRRSNT